MADGVDAAMERDQPAERDLVVDCVGTVPAREQLPTGHDAVLPSREPCDGLGSRARIGVAMAAKRTLGAMVAVNVRLVLGHGPSLARRTARLTPLLPRMRANRATAHPWTAPSARLAGEAVPR